ncbi:hypothetical protein QNM99_11695 [Pseudomonas sp. PCH446]
MLVQSAFKLFLAYEQPWWRSLGLVAGRSVTDLPVRQIYYMGTECEQQGGEPTLNSLLMASYNDIGTVPFWKGLEGGAPFVGHMPSNLAGLLKTEPVVPRTQFTVSDEMVRVAQMQVTQVHDQVELPRPYSAVYHAWDADPTAAAGMSGKPITGSTRSSAACADRWKTSRSISSARPTLMARAGSKAP